jgi:hypothetical protein
MIDNNPKGAWNWSNSFSRVLDPARSIGLHQAVVTYNQDEIHITCDGVSFYGEGVQVHEMNPFV